MNNSEQFAASKNSGRMDKGNSNSYKDSKIVNMVFWFGLLDVVIGLLMVIFAGANQPMIFISGILLVAVGIFTMVIAKFSTWWKFG